MSEDWTNKPGRYVMGDIMGDNYSRGIVDEAAEFQAARERTEDEVQALAEEARDYAWPSAGNVAYPSGMIREEIGDRPRFDLLVPKGVPYEHQMLTRFAALLARGAKKYAERNWERANSQEELDRAKQSAFRHFAQWMCDEPNEDHAASVMFNILAAETIRYKLSEEA